MTMPVIALSLRGKILLGTSLLLVPLGLALTFAYQLGSSGVRTAESQRRELRGEAAPNPLALALHQTVGQILEAVQNLEPLAPSVDGSLEDRDRLLLGAWAHGLVVQATLLQKQATSWQASGPLPDLAASIAQTALAIETDARGPALGGRFDSALMRQHYQTILPLVDQFRAQGIQALTSRIDAQIEALSAELTLAFLLALAGLVPGALVLFLVTTGIRRRAWATVAALGSLAQGELNRGLAPRLTGVKDELGRIAGSVQVLQRDLKTQVKGIEAALVDLSQIGADLNASVEESSASVAQMSAITAQVALSSQTQSTQTDQAHQVVTEMVDRILHSNELTQGMAAQFFLFSQSMEANRTRIKETAAEAQTARERAGDLEVTGEQGEKSLENLKASIGGVVQRTAEIQEIVRFILDIADQTNLLSMNAAIEAAHAGAAGRGFSIVADEIRKLAVNSSRQAQTIQNLLDGITAAVGRTLADSETTARSFQTLKSDITAVKNASRDIAQKMAAQEAEDESLSAGLLQFAQFYAQLSEALDVQTDESHQVLKTLSALSAEGKAISRSMEDQNQGMQRSANASRQVRDTTMTLGQVIQVLEVQIGRFKT